MSTDTGSFTLQEATIGDVHGAYAAGGLTARQLTQTYLDRIEAYDRNGPGINSVITVNPTAMEEADRLDAAFERSGPVGPLHGIPVLLKDQADLKGTPTTLGSVLFEDYYPDRDCRVVEKLKQAGAIVLAKTTLGELGGGDTHGSLFGSTRNPYDLRRTVGGSSGGSGAAVSANLGTLGVGQEGLASIRRPSTWNCIAGMRPTAGLVSRSGVYSGWPQEAGSLGPMARTVRDMAVLLDVMVGYDPEDPLTARGVGHAPRSYTDFLDADALRGARIGVLREPMGYDVEPGSDDFRSVAAVFDRAVTELRDAGAEAVDPVTLPRLNELLATRCASPTAGEEAFRVYMSRSADPPYWSRADVARAPDFHRLSDPARKRLMAGASPEDHYRYLLARDHLMIHLLKAMAENRLDAVVHKSVEHQPTLISEGVKPPYVNHKGAPHLNTFLVYVPTVAVPAGFTSDGLPAGVSFLGRPYDDGRMIGFAYAYEQATRHRRPPAGAP